MRPEAGSAASWLAYARSDLSIAKYATGSNILLESLCFHAQQAAEKAIKAVLIQSGVPVNKTHSIEFLVDLLPLSVDRAPILADAAQLSDYAVTSRYPGDELPVSDDEYAEAVRISEAVVIWAESIVG